MRVRRKRTNNCNSKSIMKLSDGEQKTEKKITHLQECGRETETVNVCVWDYMHMIAFHARMITIVNRFSFLGKIPWVESHFEYLSVTIFGIGSQCNTACCCMQIHKLILFGALCAVLDEISVGWTWFWWSSHKKRINCIRGLNLKKKYICSHNIG